MGLDLMLYRKKQWEDEHAWYEAEYKRRSSEGDPYIHSYEGEIEELAYSRKTWSLVDFFCGRDDTKEIIKDYAYEITKDAYIELCEKVLPYENFIEAIYKSEQDTELDEQTSEYIFYKVFGQNEDTPQLGYIWDCCALYRWCFENRDKILKAFDEEPIVMIMSW